MPSIIIYDEGVEWVFSTNAPARVQSGPGGAHTGLNSIGGTNDNAGDTAVLTAPSTISISSFGSLSFWLQPIGANWTNVLADFTVFWLTTGGVQVGNTISVKTAKYGFDPSNSVYQNLIVPVADFGVGSAPITGLQFTAQPKTTFSFLLDTVVLNIMALSSTDPSVLAGQANCMLQCISPGQQLAVQTFILATIAGLPTDAAGAQALANSARCFMQCIAPGEMLAVQDYILAQIAS